MAKLYFKVGSDWEEVVKLRNEISKLKQELKIMDSTQSPAAFKTLNTQLAASTQRMDELVTNAAKAGAVMEGDFKKKIFTASQSVNGFTEKIITQKAVVKDVEADVKRLGEAYRSALKNNPLSANSKLSEYTSAKKALDEDKAALFQLTQQQAEARLSVKKLRDEYALYNNDGKKVTETNNGMAISWKQALGVIGGAAALKSFASEMVRVRGEFQEMETSIKTLVGDTMANKLIPRIKELAKISPLTMTDMVGAEKMMLGFNIEADKTIDYLKALSDISMGSSSKFNSLTLAFSQMSATGKLMGQDLNQMINAGFNPLQQISEKTGKSIEILKGEMSKGAISAEMVQQAFIDATSAGGKFFGMSENASNTINGQISMMHDAMDAAFNEMGTKSEGFIMSAIQGTTSLMQNYETVGKVLAGLVITYGAYRAAVILSTIATSKHTVAEVALTNVRVLARKAQLALNAAMLTNPYVLLATAVVGLGAAMWAFHDSSTEAEKAQKRFNERQEEATKQEQEHKQRIDELVSSSRDIALADLQRGESLAELRKEYPRIFEKYDIETIKLADILKLKQQIAEEDAKRAGEKREKVVFDIESEIKYYENLLKSLSGQQGVDGYVKKLKQLRLDRDMMLQDKGKGISEQFVSTLKDVDVSEFDKYISELEKRIKGIGENGKVKMKLPIDTKGSLSDEAIYDVKDIKTLIDTTKAAKKTKEELGKAEKKSSADWLSSYKKVYEDAEKAYKDFLNSKKVMSDADRDKELKRLKGIRDSAKTTYEAKGGSVSSDTKQDSAAEKLRKEQEKYKLLLDKQKLESIRAEQDAQNEIDQAQINALQDGSNKTLRQRALNHKKELEAIQREAEDKRRAVIESARAAFEADPKNKKKTFDAEKYAGSDEAKKQFIPTNDIAEAKTATVNIRYKRGDDLKGLLDEYKDYTDKRLAIEKKFNDDLATLDEQRRTALKNGDTQQVEQIDRAKAEAIKKKGEDLIGLDYEQLKKAPEYVRAFENLKETSSVTLNSLLSQLQNAKQVAARTLSPDQLREYTSTIQSIMDELDSRNPFQALIDKKKELAEAEQELANAQIALETAKNQLEDVKSGKKVEIVSSKYNPSNGKIDIIKTYLTEEQALARLKTATDNLNESRDNVVRKGAQVQKIEKQLVDVFGELFSQIANVGSAIGGVTGEIIGMIGQIGTTVSGTISALNDVSQTASAAIQAVERASIILAAISVAIQVISKVVSIFSSTAKEKEEFESLKSTTEALIKVWDDLIERKKEYISMHAGEDAVKASEEALETLKKQIDVTKNLANATLGITNGGHSMDYRMWEGSYKYNGQNWKDVAPEIEKELGVPFKGMSDMLNMSSDQLQWIKDHYIGFWVSMDDTYKEQLETLIKSKKEAEEIGDALKESLTQISFDSVRSNFKDMLLDMTSDGEDWADNFEKMMQRAVIGNFVDSEDFQNKLKAWYEDFSNAMKNGLDEGERNELRNRYNEIVQEGVDFRNEAMETMGWSSGEYVQTATSKGSQAMSQDTGDELNGRFSALQMAGEEIKSQSIKQTELLSSINEKMSLADLTNDNLPLLLAPISPGIAEQARGAAVGSIQQVNVVFPTDELKALTQKMSNLEAIVDEMRTHQVEKFADIAEDVSKMTKNNPVMNGKLDDINSNIKRAL